MTAALASKKTSRSQTYWGIIAATLLALTGVLANKCVNVMYPDIARDFSVPIGTTQWLMTGYMLANAITAATTAYLLNRITARKVELIAATAYIAGALCDALAVDFPMLVIGRIVQGIAIGLAMPILWFLVFTQISHQKTGTVSGWIGAAIGVMCTVGPLYSGWACDRVSWRLVFWTLVPAAILSLVLGQLTIRNKPAGNSHPFSFGALALLAVAFACLDVAVSAADSTSLSPLFWICLFAGLVALGCFVAVNNRGATRLFNLRLFAIPAISFAAVSYFLAEAINVGMQAFLPTYAQYALGASALLGGFTIVPGSALGSVASVVAGKWADRSGFGKPIVTGAVLTLIGTASVALLQRSLTVWLLLALYIFQRVGFDFVYQNTLSHASHLVPAGETADLNAIFNVIGNYSGAIGSGILLSLFAFGRSATFGSALAKAFAGGRLAFVCGALASVIMVITSILVFVTGKRRVSGEHIAVSR